MLTQQIRKKQFAEFYTPSWLIKQMLDKLDYYGKNIFDDPTKTFLDPSCGNGNFLIAVAIRKLQHGHDQLQIAKTIFGIDIIPDNVESARSRLVDLLGEGCKKIITNNIRCADTLKVELETFCLNDVSM